MFKNEVKMPYINLRVRVSVFSELKQLIKLKEIPRNGVDVNLNNVTNYCSDVNLNNVKKVSATNTKY